MEMAGHFKGNASGDGVIQTFAEKMLKKMGWTEGKGLGKNESGMKDFIKPKMKFNTKGIGFMGVDNKWVAHQEHFNDLLRSLNKGEKSNQQQETACLTSESKLRGRTKFYSKMIRGKDLSSRSANELSSIIVPLSKKDDVQKPETSKLPSEIEDGLLKASKISMNDYFARIMAQRKPKLSGTADTKESSSGSVSIANSDKSNVGGKQAFDHLRFSSAAVSSDSTEVDDDAQPSKKSKKNPRQKDAAANLIDCNCEKFADPAENSKDTTEKQRRQESLNLKNSKSNNYKSSIEDIEEGEASTMLNKNKKEGNEEAKPEIVELVDEGVSPNYAASDEDKGKPHRDKKEKTKKRKRVEKESNTRRAELSTIEDEDIVCLDSIPKKTKRDKSDESAGRTKYERAKVTSEEVKSEKEPVMMETENDHDSSIKRKKDKKVNEQINAVDDEARFEEYSDDATRLNIKLRVLRKIRGPSLKASKAKAIRELNDEQIQEVYSLWSKGDYGEFMRKVHAGELPRWVGMEKHQVARMSSGEGKIIDLVELREILRKRFSGSNLHEIWGYTSIAYVAL